MKNINKVKYISSLIPRTVFLRVSFVDKKFDLARSEIRESGPTAFVEFLDNHFQDNLEPDIFIHLGNISQIH